MQFPVSFQSAKEAAKEDQKSTRLEVDGGERGGYVARFPWKFTGNRVSLREEAKQSGVRSNERGERRRHLKSTFEKIMATDLKTTLRYFVERVSDQLIRGGGGRKCSFECDSFRNTTKRTILRAKIEIHIVEFTSSTREESRLDGISIWLITREEIFYTEKQSILFKYVN